MYTNLGGGGRFAVISHTYNAILSQRLQKYFALLPWQMREGACAFSSLEHRYLTNSGAIRIERRLLPSVIVRAHLCEVVGGVPVEHHPSYLTERVLSVGPHLGDIEGVELAARGFFEAHHL